MLVYILLIVFEETRKLGQSSRIFDVMYRHVGRIGQYLEISFRRL